MMIVTEHAIKQGGTVKVDLPNLSLLKQQIPMKISVLMRQTSAQAELVPAKDISVMVACDKSNILSLQPAYFQLSNEIDLAEYRCKLNEGTNVSVTITNNSSSVHRTYQLQVQYVKTYGSIIYQNSFCEFDTVASQIHSAGVCTRMILKFNHPVKGAELVSLYNRVPSGGENNADDGSSTAADDEWFDSLELGDTDENSYIIDLTDSELRIYSSYLNLMRLVIPKTQAPVADDDDDDEDDKLRLHVVAYGFTRSKN